MFKPRYCSKGQILDSKFCMLSVFHSMCLLDTKRKMAFERYRSCKPEDFQSIFSFLEVSLLSSHFLIASSYFLICNFIRCWVLYKHQFWTKELCLHNLLLGLQMLPFRKALSCEYSISLEPSPQRHRWELGISCTRIQFTLSEQRPACRSCCSGEG